MIKTPWILVLLLLGIFIPFVGLTAQESTEVALYDLFQIQFEVDTPFTNPYDPSEIRVEGIFTAPDGSVDRVPAFYMQPYVQIGEAVQATGEPTWEIRFTPTQVGDWRYRIEVQTEDDTETIQNGDFLVTLSDQKGFVQISPNQHYFQFENGEAYFPIGQNLGWAEDLPTYLEWLDEIAAHGGNYARIFVDTAWFIGLDWQRPAGNYEADQLQAWYMDQILTAAAERNIYLQVVLIWHQAFIQRVDSPVNLPSNISRIDTEADFDDHAYNQANGGVLSRPESLYANSLVRDLLKRKLLYMVARWGYSPQIFAWELISQVERLPEYSAEHAEFVLDLTDYLRELDPYPHLMTIDSTSTELTQDERFDFVQTRFYQTRPIETAPDQVSSVLNGLYGIPTNKPFLLTEFSLNPWFEPTADDPRGIHIHNTLWATALSGAGGSAMPQWWDTYIAPQDLYHYYLPLSRFTADIPWGLVNLQPIQVGLSSARDEPYQALRLDNFNRNFRSASPPDTVYTVTSEGVVPPISQMSSYLYGTGFNAEASRPQTLVISPPIATNLAIGIRDVAPNGNAILFIGLDNQPYATLNLNESSRNTTINIPLTEGQHRIVLDNIGADWIELDYLSLEAYIPSLQAVSLADQSAGIALVWLHNRDYTWQNMQQGILGAALRYNLTLPNMPNGRYQIEFWDTLTGNLLGQEVAETTNHSIMLSLPPLQTQLAVKATLIEGTNEDLPTLVPTRTPAIQPTLMPSETPTVTPSETATPTLAPSETVVTATPTATDSPIPPSETFSPTPTITASPTETLEVTPSETPQNELFPRQTRTPRP